MTLYWPVDQPCRLKPHVYHIALGCAGPLRPGYPCCCAAGLKMMINTGTVGLNTTSALNLAINETATLVASQSFTMRQFVIRVMK